MGSGGGGVGGFGQCPKENVFFFIDVFPNRPVITALWSKRIGSYVCMDFGTLRLHPIISDGNFNLVHHFIRVHYSRQMKTGPVELGADLAEKKMNKII